MTDLGSWESAVSMHVVEPVTPAEPGAGEAILATWHHLLDAGSLQDGEPFLAGTAPLATARLSAATAASIGALDGGNVAVTHGAGVITVPLTITAMPDHVVWLPTNSVGSRVRPMLGVDAGAVVGISAAGATVSTGAHA